jgi:hypothetical protein
VDTRRAADDAGATTVRIDVAGTGINLSVAQRGNVVRRVRLALSRFGRRITKVTVRVAGQVNPLGGLDRRCRARAWLQPGDGVRAETVGGPIDETVDRALVRLAERVDLALALDPPARFNLPRPPGRPRGDGRAG